MVNTATPKSVEFTLPSEFGVQQIVDARVLTQIRNAGSTERDEFCVRLALEEALTNAIRHGNKLDPQKKVYVRSTVRGKQITIEIEDEGDGFDPGAVPDPTTPEFIGRPNGRGVLLINSFMDEITYNKKGNRVVMTKTLGSVSEQMAS